MAALVDQFGKIGMMPTQLDKLIDLAIGQKTVARQLGTGQLRLGWISPQNNPAQRRTRILSEYHMLYLLRGQGSFTDQHGQTTTLTAGIRLDRHPNQSHTIERVLDGRWLEFFITLSPTLHDAICQLGILQPSCVISHIPVTTGLLKVMLQTIDSLHVDVATSATVVQRLVNLLRCFDENARSCQQSINTNEQLQQAAHLLADMTYEHKSLPVIARQVGMSYETFRKHFARQYGVSPQHYRVAQRIQQAKHLLLETDDSIETLAQILGYHDVFGFSRQFKVVCGMSPTAYRQQSQR